MISHCLNHRFDDLFDAKTSQGKFRALGPLLVYDRRIIEATCDRPTCGAADITPEVKQAIADEVRRQIDLEMTEGQSIGSNSMQSPVYNDSPPMFSDNASHVFVVSNSLLVIAGDQECTISEGDVLQLDSAQSSNGTATDVVVLASKTGDCRKGSVVSVQLQDLQEMQNHMRETLDEGLADLKSRQGKEGLPSLPLEAAAKPVDAPFAAEAKPDKHVEKELSEAEREAERAEQDVINQSLQNPENSGGTITISLGQTIEEITSVLGTPKTIVDLGEKTIYVYKDMKITFTGGKVSDVQ